VGTGCVHELTFTSSGNYADPYNDVDLDVVFTAPTGETLRVPGFWAGGATWKVRFSAREPGRYSYRTEASVTQDGGLHGRTGTVMVERMPSSNPLVVRGRVRVAVDKRHFEYMGHGAALWRQLPWWDLERHPEWVEEGKESDQAYGIICVGIPRRLRVVYAPLAWNAPTLQAIEPDVQYRAQYYDPVTGAEIPLGAVTPDAEGAWIPPLPPEVHDWILVAEVVAPQTKVF
jgi:hypothetical protein